MGTTGPFRGLPGTSLSGRRCTRKALSYIWRPTMTFWMVMPYVLIALGVIGLLSILVDAYRD